MKRKLIYINIILGVVLWFGYCTDYSLPGTIPDIISPIIVAVVGLISFMIFISDKGFSVIGITSSLISLIGGGLFVLLIIVSLIFPFWLWEVAGEVQVQEVESPNGLSVATVYFRPVGAYTGGNGRIFIRVKYRWFPLVERDVYAAKTFEEPNNYDFIEWLDNTTILAKEKNEIVKIGVIKFQLPLFIR
jgi:hypothetical protein